MTQRTITIKIEKDGKWYSGWTDDFPGAFGQGKTVEEAKESVRQAIKLLLEVEAEEKATRSARMKTAPV